MSIFTLRDPATELARVFVLFIPRLFLFPSLIFKGNWYQFSQKDTIVVT